MRALNVVSNWCNWRSRVLAWKPPAVLKAVLTSPSLALSFALDPWNWTQINHAKTAWNAKTASISFSNIQAASNLDLLEAIPTARQFQAPPPPSSRSFVAPRKSNTQRPKTLKPEEEKKKKWKGQHKHSCSDNLQCNPSQAFPPELSLLRLLPMDPSCRLGTTHQAALQKCWPLWAHAQQYQLPLGPGTHYADTRKSMKGFNILKSVSPPYHTQWNLAAASMTTLMHLGGDGLSEPWPTSPMTSTRIVFL